MSGAAIPDEKDIARICKRSFVDEENKIGHGAFVLNHHDNEVFLSVNCLQTVHAEIEEALRILQRTHPYKGKGRKNALFAVLHVGTARSVVSEGLEDHRWIRILDESTPGHLS